MEWIKYSEYNLPPQGRKILWWNKGDCWVAQRFNYKGKSYWFPLPFCDSRLARLDPPEYWAYLDLPLDYTGYMYASVEGEPMNFDELEKKHEWAHKEFVEILFRSMKKKNKKER